MKHSCLFGSTVELVTVNRSCRKMNEQVTGRYQGFKEQCPEFTCEHVSAVKPSDAPEYGNISHTDKWSSQSYGNDLKNEASTSFVTCSDTVSPTNGLPNRATMICGTKHRPRSSCAPTLSQWSAESCDNNPSESAKSISLSKMSGVSNKRIVLQLLHVVQNDDIEIKQR